MKSDDRITELSRGGIYEQKTKYPLAQVLRQQEPVSPKERQSHKNKPYIK
jgi:hypothetical protein